MELSLLLLKNAHCQQQEVHHIVLPGNQVSGNNCILMDSGVGTVAAIAVMAAALLPVPKGKTLESFFRR